MKYITTDSLRTQDLHYSFVAQENTTYFLRMMNTSAEEYFKDQISKINTIQLQEGNIVPEYGLYGKYKIAVKVSGENMFSLNNINEIDIRI